MAMGTVFTVESQHRSKRDEYRLSRMMNLGARLETHFGSGYLHAYKRSRYTPVDTNRIQRFLSWLDTTDNNLFAISLNDYASDGLDGNSEVSKVSVLGTIRGAIKRFLRSQECLDYIADMVDLWEQKEDESQALTIAQSIQKSILSKVTKDKYVRVMVKRDNTHAILKGIRLAHTDLKYLIEGLWADYSLRGLQNACIVALLGGFGLRSDEALNVHVEDIAHGHLFVRSGKGAKERSIPYAEDYFYIKVIRKWLDIAGITEGKILRSMNRWQSIGTRLSYRGLKYILDGKAFEVKLDGDYLTPLPHDYRKGASRMWFDAGMTVYDVAQNLGHTNNDGQLNIELTTQYIGLTGSEDRMLSLA